MKRLRYAINGKLRMLRAAEQSGDVERWARERQIDPELLSRWLKDRDSGRLRHQPAPGQPNTGRASNPESVSQAPQPPSAGLGSVRP